MTFGLRAASSELALVPQHLLVATGDVDHADWNYRGLLGYVSRQRFELVRKLLPRRRVDRILEIGYGSGVFLPELARASYEVHGADVHEHVSSVTRSLARLGVDARLVRSASEALPYPDDTFDVVVAISTFEFVDSADRAIAEVARVLRPAGRAIVVTPNVNPLLDAALRLATGESAQRDFADRRERVIPALRRAMLVEHVAQFPTWTPIPIYRAFRLSKRTPMTIGRAPAITEPNVDRLVS